MKIIYDPIHTTQKRGRLLKLQRKIEQQVPKQHNSLIIKPSFSKVKYEGVVWNQQGTHTQNNISFRISEGEKKRVARTQQSIRNATKNQFGSFRTIHSLRGEQKNQFPLRSITLIKPFRRCMIVHQGLTSQTQKLESTTFNQYYSVFSETQGPLNKSASQDTESIFCQTKQKLAGIKIKPFLRKQYQNNGPQCPQ